MELRARGVRKAFVGDLLRDDVLKEVSELGFGLVERGQIEFL